ncbi:MFS transporter [Rhodococcus cerastii]|nr:MFS transporter [Rhodococcus cerastii]
MRNWTGLVVLAFAVLLIAVDATVLDLALPSVSNALAPSGTQLLWIIDVYSFVIAGLLVTMGALGDRLGRRRLLLLGAFGFGVASMLAAWSTSPEMMIAARVLQGVAGATLMPATLALIRSMFTDSRQRTTAIGVWSAMAGGGAALGPLVGGWLLEHYWWGSVFLINVPVMIVLLIVGPRVIPESTNPEPGKFDVPSAGLSMLAIVPVVYAVKEIAVHGPTITAAGMALGGSAAGVIFVRRQRTLADPMLDLKLFNTKTFTSAIVIDFCAVFALAGVLFFGSQYLQAVLGYSPFSAGLLMFPGAMTSVVASALAPLLIRRWHPGTVLCVGFVASATGAGMLGWLQPDRGAAVFVAGFVLIGIGVGGALTLTSDLIVSAVDENRAGAASAVSETTYELGAALGVAVVGSVVMSIYRRGLDVVATAQSPAAAETISNAVNVAQQLPAPQAEQFMLAATTAFVDGIRVAAAITALLLVAAAYLAARLRLLPAVTNRVE